MILIPSVILSLPTFSFPPPLLSLPSLPILSPPPSSLLQPSQDRWKEDLHEPEIEEEDAMELEDSGGMRL